MALIANFACSLLSVHIPYSVLEIRHLQSIAL